MRFSIKDFFSKCNQIRRKMRIWWHLLKKSLMENFIFCAVASTCAFSSFFKRLCWHWNFLRCLCQGNRYFSISPKTSGLVWTSDKAWDLKTRYHLLSLIYESRFPKFARTLSVLWLFRRISSFQKPEPW